MDSGRINRLKTTQSKQLCLIFNIENFTYTCFHNILFTNNTADVSNSKTNFANKLNSYSPWCGRGGGGEGVEDSIYLFTLINYP